MTPPRLIHDTARDLAAATVGVFSSLLREEEQVEAFRELYGLIKCHLEHFVLTQAREQKRLYGGPLETPPTT